MGHIKESDGVDFIIKGKPLTEKEKKQLVNLLKWIKKELQSKKPAGQECIHGQKKTVE